MSTKFYAAAAWDAVKDKDDPQFAGCAAGHQEALLARAEAVIKTGVVADEATAGVFGRFEAKVRELATPPVAETVSEVAENVSEVDTGDKPTDLSKLTRAALDELAVAKGLDPESFATKADVIAALEA